MKVLVTGAAGQVGRSLAVQALEQGHEVVAGYNSRRPALHGTELIHIDKVDGAEARASILATRPEWIVDTGALHNVDYCELHPEEAFLVNRDGTRNLAEAAAAIGATFVFISTDFVFDGQKPGPYVEGDAPNPRSQYASSKLAGERATATASPSHIIVRPSVVYSWLDSRGRAESSSGKGVNFGTWLVEEVAHGRPVRIIADQIASPTLAEDLASAVLALLKSGASGTFHAAGATAISRFQFSVNLVNRLGLDPSFVKPVATAELQQRARRPGNSSLDSSRLTAVAHHRMLELPDALDHFARAFYLDSSEAQRS